MSEGDAWLSSIGALIVLKIVIVDICITGFGDAITDIAQVTMLFCQKLTYNCDTQLA